MIERTGIQCGADEPWGLVYNNYVIFQDVTPLCEPVAPVISWIIATGVESNGWEFDTVKLNFGGAATLKRCRVTSE